MAPPATSTITQRVTLSPMSRRFSAVITHEPPWYVAHCPELGVVSQGRSLDEAKANLREAVELYLESFGTDELSPEPPEITLTSVDVPVAG